MTAAEIIAKHVSACVRELREYAVGEAIAALTTPRRIRQERAARPIVKTRRPVAKRSPRAKPAASSARPCGCSAKGRHRASCIRDGQEPPQPVERSPRVERAGSGGDSPRVKAPVDETRAQRFARIEAAAQKRNGASA